MTQDQFCEVILRAWNEPEFGERLKANPKQVLAAMQIDLPGDAEIVVVERSVKKRLPNKNYIMLPVAPARERISIRHIAAVAGSPNDPAASPSWTSLLCCRNTTLTSNKCCKF
jgi:hypothetical protein